MKKKGIMKRFTEMNFSLEQCKIIHIRVYLGAKLAAGRLVKGKADNRAH